MLHTLVYTDMDSHARDVVERYYAAFDAHRNEWQTLVTDDVVFEGPVQHARGKAAFVDLTAQFLGAHHATRLLRGIADGSTVTSQITHDGVGLNLTDYIVQAGEQLIVRLAQLHELEVQQLEPA